MCDVLKLKQHKAIRKIKSLCSELFTESGLSQVPVKKHYDEKDLNGLSRAEQLDMMFGHLMEEESRESEPEK